jgi:hypothetical protein
MPRLKDSGMQAQVEAAATHNIFFTQQYRDLPRIEGQLINHYPIFYGFLQRTIPVPDHLLKIKFQDSSR